MLKQGAPTRRRIIPQKMKSRCQTREMKVFSKQMHKGDESILKDVSTKSEMKVFSNKMHKGDESILKDVSTKGDESILKQDAQGR